MIEPNSALFVSPLRKCDRNKQLIYGILSESCSKSIAQIAEESGLHPCTCTRLLKDMVAEGWIPPSAAIDKVRYYYKQPHKPHCSSWDIDR